MNATTSTRKSKTKPPRDLLHSYSSEASTDDIIQHLQSLGKIIVSRAELQQMTPYSARTIRRFELSGKLKPLKGTHTKSYLVADLAVFIQEVR